jgi:sporulation protein YlmC with PRC-barrel domain
MLNHRKVYKENLSLINMAKKPFSSLLGKLIVTKEGKRLGLVKDVTFEANTGELIQVVIRDATTYTKNLNLERTKEEEPLVPFNSIIAVGDFVVISEEDLV